MSQGKKVKLTAEIKEIIIASLKLDGNVTTAARLIGVARTVLYNCKKRDKTFSKAWDTAVEEAIDLLEQEARRRAYDGVDEPVYFKGSNVGTIRKYSDNLLMFMLKAHRPKKFQDRWQIKSEVSGKVEIEHSLDPTLEEKLEQIINHK